MTSAPALPAKNASAIIDIYKKLAVVRKPEDSISYTDVSGKIVQITDLTNSTSVRV